MEALERFGRFLPRRPGGGTPVWGLEVIEAVVRKVEQLRQVEIRMVPALGALLIGMPAPFTQLAPEHIAELMAAWRCAGHFSIIVCF